jgi:hypothetical protein
MIRPLALVILLLTVCVAAEPAAIPADHLATAKLVGAAVHTSTATWRSESDGGGVLHLAITDVAEDPWGIQLLTPTTRALRAGERLRLSLRVRCIEPSTDGAAELAVFLQRSEPPYDKALNKRLTPGIAWETVACDVTVQEDLAAGQAQLGFFLGIRRGIYELADVRLATLP